MSIYMYLCTELCKAADQSYKVVLSLLLAGGLELELDETIFFPQPFPLIWEKSQGVSELLIVEACCFICRQIRNEVPQRQPKQGLPFIIYLQCYI